MSIREDYRIGINIPPTPLVAARTWSDGQLQRLKLILAMFGSLRLPCLSYQQPAPTESISQKHSWQAARRCVSSWLPFFQNSVDPAEFGRPDPTRQEGCPGPQ